MTTDVSMAPVQCALLNDAIVARSAGGDRLPDNLAVVAKTELIRAVADHSTVLGAGACSTAGVAVGGRPRRRGYTRRIGHTRRLSNAGAAGWRHGWVGVGWRRGRAASRL